MSRMESPDDAQKTVSVRADSNLVDEFDDVLDERGRNRSEAIREFMRSVADNPTDDGILQPPTDDETLAQGYKALVEASAGGERGIPLREAKSVVAQATGIDGDVVGRRVIHPLRERGYLSRSGDPIHDPWLEVR